MMAFQRFRRIALLLAATGGISFSGAAWAAPKAAPPKKAAAKAPSPASCAKAYAAAEEREDAGSLREARDMLLSCTHPACGKLLQRECAAQYNRVDSEIPAVVFHVADDKGAPRTDVDVRMDGQPLVSKLDGQPVQIDPGLHEFAFATPDGAHVSKKIMILEGENDRSVDVSLGPAPAGAEPSPPAESHAPAAANSPGKAPPILPEAPEPPLPATPSALPFVLGGLGLAAAGAGATLWALGKEKTLDLAVDGVAVGAGAIVGALWLFGRPHPSQKKAAACTVDVHPMASGGVASVSGTF